MGDEMQLQQLFQNLIANAVKFRCDAPPRVVVTARATGKLWQFSVSDNGIGIDKKYADRVFQMFQRLHARHKYPGSGIGLAIAKRIVERHGVLGRGPHPQSIFNECGRPGRREIHRPEDLFHGGAIGSQKLHGKIERG